MSRSVPLLHRFLHRFYHRGAAVQHWFSSRIRATGTAALSSLTFAAFMTIGQPKNSIFQLFCFLLGLVTLSLVWVVFRRADLLATHQLPPHATVGEPVKFSVLIENKGRRAVKCLRLLQSPPDPRPPLAEFSALREPGEENRNPFDRTMIYYRWQWLLSRKRGFSSPESIEVGNLAKAGSTQVTMELTPHNRGVVQLHEIRALLPDPLGFFQKCISVDAKRTGLVVLPRRYRLPHFEMPGQSTSRTGGEETGSQIGNVGEFVGVREYRPGDPMRQIHWKSWAHTGKPMVKELEENFYPRFGLVLDTFPGSPDGNVFEGIVSVAASFIVGLDRSDSLLELMFIADKAHKVTAGHGTGGARGLLEVLSAVHVEETARFRALSETVLRHRETMTSCLLVLNGWDEERESFVKGLMKNGVVCVPLVIGKGSAPDGLKGRWIDSGEIQRDLLRLPPHLSEATL